jgi:hypothetical protein
MALLDAAWTYAPKTPAVSFSHNWQIWTFSPSVFHIQVLCIYNGCSKKSFQSYFVVPSYCAPEHCEVATLLVTYIYSYSWFVALVAWGCRWFDDVVSFVVSSFFRVSGVSQPCLVEMNQTFRLPFQFATTTPALLFPKISPFFHFNVLRCIPKHNFQFCLKVSTKFVLFFSR